MSKTDPMPISLISDEYTSDPATAFELGRRWEIEHFEIRQAYRWRVPVGPAWAAERVAAAVRECGVKVTGISPGLFKPTMRTDGSSVPIGEDAPAEIRRHLDELLGEFFNFAEALGTRNITVFALPRGPDQTGDAPPEVVVDALAEAAEHAAAENFTLLLENCSGSWADTAAATAAVLDAVDSPALKLVWDPANAAMADPKTDPVATGYPWISRHVANVHVKDLAVTDGKAAWTMIGDGIVDWPEQLRRLAADGYDGFLTLEPHLQYLPGQSAGLVAMIEQYLTRVRKLVDDAC